LTQTAYNQGSFVTAVLSATLAAHCGALILHLYALNLFSTVPIGISFPLHLSGFLPICQNQIQGLFKDFQGPYEGYIRRTKLNQTGTFISIYKQVQFTFDNLTPASINQKLELSEKFTKCINSCD